jgi:hypothetical protein
MNVGIGNEAASVSFLGIHVSNGRNCVFAVYGGGSIPTTGKKRWPSLYFLVLAGKAYGTISLRVVFVALPLINSEQWLFSTNAPVRPKAPSHSPDMCMYSY